MNLDRHDVTRLLRAAREGAPASMDRLLPVVYDELKERAARHLRDERGGHTLQTTALVHEAYLRLVDIDDVDWVDRGHFFSVASRCMRRILVDHARRHLAEKRGGGRHRMDLAKIELGTIAANEELLALDDALRRLKQRAPRPARVAELKLFGGQEHARIAEAIGISLATVERDWRLARAWLQRELEEPDG